jgi:protein MpaA
MSEDAVKSFVFGKTESGLPILGYEFGTSGPEVLILGGVHGDETEGVIAGFGLVENFAQNFDLNLKLTIVPALNLDGVLAKSRCNANSIDLNRNLPSNDWTSDVANPRYNPGTKPGSESENRALVDFLEKKRPRYIVSLHSWKPMLNINGDCRSLAEEIAKKTGYIIEESIGYPTPGCLGTYAGLEREMPTITYEIERGLTAKPILDIHVPAIVDALKTIR